MRKTDKKIDNTIRKALKEVCELALGKVEGFKWLTHFSNYDSFPKSLLIVCVFETNEQLDKARCSKMDDYLSKLIAAKLSDIDVKLYNIQKQVRFVTQANCKREINRKEIELVP